MKIKFELVDNDGEPLMIMDGHNYNPNIGEDVMFCDVKNNIHIDELSKVIEKFYRIDEDTLTIECEIYNQPNDYGYSQFKKYNG